MSSGVYWRAPLFECTSRRSSFEEDDLDELFQELLRLLKFDLTKGSVGIGLEHSSTSEVGKIHLFSFQPILAHAIIKILAARVPFMSCREVVAT
jgi:hypothetical protein